MTKYDKLFNVKVRNAKQIFHDCVKLILVALLKEKHKNTEIYTEYNPSNPNDSYADIYIKLKDWTYIFEIQKEISESWLKQIQEKYDLPKTDLIVIPLKDLPTDINELTKKLNEFVI